MISLSAVAIPVFLDTNHHSTLLLSQWVRTYHYGHIYMPALCVGTCGLYGFTVLSNSRNGKHYLRYILAGATTLAMVPFTWVFMAPTNNILFGWEEASAKDSPLMIELSVVQDIVMKWAWLHVVRSLFPFLGMILGFSGLLQELRL